MNFLSRIFEPYQDDLNLGKKVVLGLQHTFTMFGATILVPLLTGLSVSVALFMAGMATLIFHIFTKGKVPIFLGSSFSFIAPIILVGGRYGLPYATGGVVVAGILFALVSLLMWKFGVDKIMSFFPPLLTGTIITIIGLMLAPVAINSAKENWLLAVISLITVAIISLFVKGFFKLIPVICGLTMGYIASLLIGVVDLTSVKEAAWFGFPPFVLAKFKWEAILIIAPVALAVLFEHIGDMVAIEQLTGKPVTRDPGLHRTILGDGLASAFSGLFGGGDTTTYSENSGVLALTKQYNPVVMRIAAVFAIILAFCPKLAAVVGSIPSGVIGGISIVLFGMIASVGLRTLIEHKVNFTKSRSMFITAVMLVFGLGGAIIPINVGSFSLEFAGVGVAAIIGIILNKLIPDKD
jgi:uracil permease